MIQSNHNAAPNIKAAPGMRPFLLCPVLSRDIEAVLAELQHRLCQIIEFHRKLRAGRSN